MTVPTTTVPAAPARRVSPSVALAERVAARLPVRNEQEWAVAPYNAWWSFQPAARMTQAGRTLILVAHAWRTDVAWQLPGREPYEPDVRLEHLAPDRIAREVLRLVLPALDDEEAARTRTASTPRAMGRLELLSEIGRAMKELDLHPRDRVGLLANSSTLSWNTLSGITYSVTLHGTNPACHVSISGPLRAVERAVTHFLPDRTARVPRQPLVGVHGRLARRMAVHWGQFAPVEQLDDGGLSIGGGTGPYGYAAPAKDPRARVRDTTHVSVDMHGIGVDLLLSVASQLTR
ncbi:hypothetical protein ACIP9H_34105 [Streptomyces sp. NPDC088732]|uniref:hypothetical protein n=1 Tax=Streptomyces sp. NPDC088732 TaxID=3365879 RepID=UPI003807DF6A